MSNDETQGQAADEEKTAVDESGVTTPHEGGGLANILAGIENVPKHIQEWIAAQESANPAIAEAIKLLSNSIATIASDIETKGLPVVEKALGDLATEALGATSGGVAKSAAGSAAVATVKAAGETLADDSLHILVTDVLTTAKAAI